MRPRRLTKLDPHEVSLVRRGANLKKFLVHKSEDAAMSAADVLEEVIKGDWEEGKHPRADDGKFGGGGGVRPATTLGHTESGKTVQQHGEYKSAAVKAVREKHGDFTAKDHLDAGRLHHQAGNTKLADAHMKASAQIAQENKTRRTRENLAASNEKLTERHGFKPARKPVQKADEMTEDQRWLLEYVAKSLGAEAIDALLDEADFDLPDDATEDQLWTAEQVEKAFGRKFGPPRATVPNPRMVQAMARQPAPLRQPPVAAAGALPVPAAPVAPAAVPPQQQPVIAQQTGAPPVAPAADIAQPLGAQLPLAAGGGLSDPAQGALKAIARILAPYKNEIQADDVAGVLEGIGIPTGEPDEDDVGDGTDDGTGDTTDAADAGEPPPTDAQPPPPRNRLDARPEYVALSLEAKPNNGEVDPMSIDLSAFPPAQRHQMEAVLKSLADDANKAWDDEKKTLIEKNAALEKRFNEEHERRVMKEYVAKAEGFDRLGAPTDKMARVLKVLNDADPELLKDLEAVLKGLNEQLVVNDELGGVMHETGSRQSGGSASSAQAKLDQLVDGYVAKDGEASLSRHQKMARILKSEDGKKLAREVDLDNERRKRRFGAA